jgi:hypothetical protein
MFFKLRHFLCMPLQTQLLDLSDARGPVGFKQQRENLGHDVIEFFALLRVREFVALGA